jgi:hypothetical protein
MSKRRALVAVAAALAITACGSSGDNGGSTAANFDPNPTGTFSAWGFNNADDVGKSRLAYVVSLLAGAARVFFDVGYQSYLPAVAGQDRLLHANSAMETVRASGQVVGPGVGGWLVATIGAANVILVQAVTFAVSAASLLAIRAPEPPNPVPDKGHRLRAQIAEGRRARHGEFS